MLRTQFSRVRDSHAQNYWPTKTYFTMYFVRSPWAPPDFVNYRKDTDMVSIFTGNTIIVHSPPGTRIIFFSPGQNIT